MAQDNASVAEQLKALTQMARDNASAVEQLKESHEQMAGLLAKVSEEPAAPDTFASSTSDAWYAEAQAGSAVASQNTAAELVLSRQRGKASVAAQARFAVGRYPPSPDPK